GAHAVADPSRAVLRAHNHEVRHVDRHRLVLDAALHRGARRLLVLLRDVDELGRLDDDHVALRNHPRDLADFADVFALDHLDAVALLDTHLHHNTSGASDTIRMNRRSRSSRPTGPKMRVPRGCIWSLISTAAFSSNRM